MGTREIFDLAIAEEESRGITQPRRPGDVGLVGTRRTRSRIESLVRVPQPADMGCGATALPADQS